MDKSLWQLSSFDSVHSSHEWPPTILSGEKHGSALSIGFIPRLRLCGRPWRLQLRGESYVLSESNICSHKLDVQEANISVSQFYRIGSYFFGCWFANGWYSCSRSLGCGDRSVAFFKEHPSSSERSLSKTKGRWSSAAKSSTQWNPKRQPQHQIEKKQWLRSWWIVSCGSRRHKRKTFLDSKLSCTFLKTMRQWSRWS